MADFPKKTLADWEKLAAKELRDRPLSSLDWVTPEGIVVKPLYTEADLENLETLGSLPGFPPFTRGPKATMYTGRPWTATSAIAPISGRARWASRWRSISPPTAATIRTIRASWATSARRAWPS